MNKHPSLLAPATDENLFCAACGCPVKAHKADLEALSRGQVIFDCGTCNKRCKRKKGAKSHWFRANNAKCRKTGEPFEGGGL